MSSISLFFLFLTFLAILVSADLLCDFTAIQIPIKNVNVTGNANARGIAITVGTPGKQYAFMPEMRLNNTWMYQQDANLCSNTLSPQSCAAYRGGLFSGPGSSTYKTASDILSAGGAPGDSNTPTFEVGPAPGGSDTFDLGSNTTISKLPFGSPRKNWGDGVFPMNSLGLGLNSTFLSALVAAGKIGTRSYSLYYGTRGKSETDGSLILGGYDAKKISGKKFQKAIGPRNATCPTGMLITAKDLSLNFPTGKNATITKSANIDFCIVPSFPGVMSLPIEPFYTNFESLTGTKRIGSSTGINLGSALYSVDAVFAGSLTLSFAQDLTITIPTSLLLTADTTLSATGSTTTSATNTTILITPLSPNSTLPIMLGQHFLSAAYLSVNQDDQTFALWPLNQQTQETQIIPIRSFSCDTPGGTASNVDPESLPHTHPHINSPGAIVAVVLSILFIILALLGLLLCVRKNKRKAQEEEDSKRMSFMDRGLAGDASEMPGEDRIRDIGLAPMPRGEEDVEKFEMWADEADAFEMETPAASWTPLGQQKQRSSLAPVDGVGGWPLDSKVATKELPAG